MNGKVWLLPFLLLMVLGTAMAAVTVTITTPVANTEYNNLPQNLPNVVDINFTVADNNASVRDLNVDIYYYASNKANGTAIVSDGNLFDWNANATSTQRCSAGTSWASVTCSYKWTLPADTTLGNGKYYLDVNVMDVTWGDGSGAVNADGNATNAFYIDNRLSNIESIKTLLATNILALVGGLLVGILAGAVVITTSDSAGKWAFAAISAIVSAAIAAMVIGVVLAAM